MNNVVVLDNPSPFYNPFQFEITFECIEDLSEGESGARARHRAVSCGLQTLKVSRARPRAGGRCSAPDGRQARLCGGKLEVDGRRPPRRARRSAAAGAPAVAQLARNLFERR